LNAIANRLAIELRNRGPRGFIRFVGLRLIQWRGDVLYERDLQEVPREHAAQNLVTIIDRHNFRTAAASSVEESVLVGGNHVYADELKEDATLLAATTPDGRVSSYAFVIFQSFYKRILGEADAVPIICNCVTLPAFRGQGLYPLLLNEACRHLAAQGHRRAIVTCAPDNLASIRGIEKAGFRKVKTLYSLVFFSRWIIYQRTHRCQSKMLLYNN
jgi:RimJ/RimL family protein N-acetyltransferase